MAENTFGVTELERAFLWSAMTAYCETLGMDVDVDETLLMMMMEELDVGKEFEGLWAKAEAALVAAAHKLYAERGETDREARLALIVMRIGTMVGRAHAQA